MKWARRIGVVALCLLAAACADRAAGRGGPRDTATVAAAQTPSQTPTWSADTRSPGSSNAGHEYGAALTAADRRDLLEYLKSL